MGRRGHGEGSIYQRSSDGRWVGQLELDRRPDGRRNRKQIYGRTQAEVVSKLRAAEMKLAQGLDLSAGRVTVAGQLEHWYSIVAPNRSANTRSTYEWAIGRLSRGLGATTLDKLTPSAVTGFLNGMSASGLAPATVNRVRSVLTQALRLAEIDGLVSRNVAALTDPVPLGRTSSRSMSEAQAATLLEATSTHRLGSLFVVQLTMGLRPGEVTGLIWEDVDLDEQVLHVRRSMKNNRGRLEFGEPKTRRSVRSLQIPLLTSERLREHRRAQRYERLEAGPLWNDHGLVFSTEVGTPIDPSNLRRTLNRITDSAGLGQWAPNELRHSAVSIMSAAGVPIEAISDQVGHETTRTTQTVYRHILNPVQPHAMVMDDVFGSSG